MQDEEAGKLMPQHEALEIPPFLRRKTGGKRRKAALPPAQGMRAPETSANTPAKVERVQLTEFVRLAETPYEEGGFAIREGIIPRRWYLPQSEEDREEAVSRLHMRMAEKALKGELKEEKESRPERVDKYAGMVNLEDVMVRAGCTDAALAKRAVRAARIENERWHFAPELLQTVVNVIREYKPGITKTARRSEFLATSRILWKGKNPKREGSDAFARWEYLRSCNGKTVAEFLASGGNPTTLKNAVAKKHVKLGETDGDSGGEGGAEIQRQGGEGVRQGKKETGAVASGESDRGGNARGTAKSKPRAGRARRHR